ncbi:MAG: hypothetical protein ACE5QW_09750 [Thermoplasmata archaeon]
MRFYREQERYLTYKPMDARKLEFPSGNGRSLFLATRIYGTSII